MNFWKPGEEQPDGLGEDNIEMGSSLPLDRMAYEQQKGKAEMSDNLKNMPFMVRSNAEQVRKNEEIAAKKELAKYMWTYRTVNATEDLEISRHPLSGPVVNILEEEECKRFSFGGFNPKVDDIMKERKDHRKRKSGVKSAVKSGEIDVKETLKKYSTFRDRPAKKHQKK